MELLKLLLAPHATPALATMAESGLLVPVLGGVPDLAGFENMAKVEAARFVLRVNRYHDLRAENPDYLAAIWWDEIGKLLSEREMKNKIEREGLSAEAARKSTDHQALLHRIRSFFGLT